MYTMEAKQTLSGVPYKYGLTDEHKEAALNALNSKSGFIEGPENRNFEKEIAAYCGTNYAVTVSSGTAALHLALLACGVEAGDEVITVSNSFNSSADVILLAGARPVFVDVDPKTFNIRTDLIEEKISSKTKAILPVDFGGHPADMDPINEIAQKHALRVVEDAAQAFGAAYKGKRAGALGDVGVVSFVHHKHVTVFGDGGAALTDDEKLARSLRMLSNHGRGEAYYGTDELGVPRQKNEVAGFNYRLSELHAALGRVSLKHFIQGKTGLERRWDTARLYNDMLKDLPHLQLPVEFEWAKHSYLRYLILAPDRNGLYAFLRSRAIDVSIHYRIPIHLLPYFAQFGFKRGDFPVTEHYTDHTLSLPMCPPGYSREEVEYVTSLIKDYYAQNTPKSSKIRK